MEFGKVYGKEEVECGGESCYVYILEIVIWDIKIIFRVLRIYLDIFINIERVRVFLFIFMCIRIYEFIFSIRYRYLLLFFLGILSIFFYFYYILVF